MDDLVIAKELETLISLDVENKDLYLLILMSLERSDIKDSHLKCLDVLKQLSLIKSKTLNLDIVRLINVVSDYFDALIVTQVLTEEIEQPKQEDQYPYWGIDLASVTADYYRQAMANYWMLPTEVNELTKIRGREGSAIPPHIKKKKFTTKESSYGSLQNLRR